MKLYSLLTALATAALDGPMQLCDSTNAFQVSSVTLDPYPLQTGKLLKVVTKGLVTQELTAGSRMNLVAKLGFLKIIDENYDLCELHKDQGGCPITGDTIVNFSRMISDKYPNAKIGMEMRVFDAMNNTAVCLSGKLEIVQGQ